MHNIDERTERIVKWREAMATLPDARFFEIMRAYLGEIHTPFNKHKLIERLSSVLRNADNRENIRLFISDFDIKMITAVSMLEKPTQEKLAELFVEEYDFAAVYAELMNLSDRLILYPHTREDGTKEFRLNPLLDDVLMPFINLNTLLPAAKAVVFASKTECASNALSPLFIGALVSCVNMFPDMCKSDGDLKKKSYERLGAIFAGQTVCAALLVKAFINLGIFKFGEEGLFTDSTKLAAFAELNACEQYTYLAVSAAVRFGRENLRIHAQLLADSLSSIPADGFTKQIILRTMFILANKKNKAEVKTSLSRFERILEAHCTRETPQCDTGGIAPAILEAAIEFGILIKQGESEMGEESFSFNADIVDSAASEREAGEAAHSVIINAGNSITVMPHLRLKDVLSLAEFTDIARYSTACEFELTKKSVSRAFDKNRTPEDIYRALEIFSAHAIPQSLKMNVEEWYDAYSGALLYSGYVLKADEKTQRIIENSPALAQLIRQKLADGIFLLDITDGKDALKIIAKAGIDIIASVKTAAAREERAVFPHIAYGKNKIERGTHPALPQTDTKSCVEKINALLKIAETLELDAQQKECLVSRIQQKLIISPSQLHSDCLHIETFEADGTEYFRKLRLLEDAAAAHDMAHITLPDDQTGGALRTLTGRVLAVLRAESGASVRLELSPNTTPVVFPVSKITRIKVMRGFGTEGVGKG